MVQKKSFTKGGISQERGGGGIGRGGSKTDGKKNRRVNKYTIKTSVKNTLGGGNCCSIFPEQKSLRGERSKKNGGTYRGLKTKKL